ncbi:hypothetical protein [Vibrio gallaecicus]|uniref:hypothetical protein n=1 Tax=Vibrio gallaecicus TaxID=552386 RepID=UPI0025B3D9B4|nr:hypothetical protein [Vibrio gallaecicus]MDN3613776.1 hypothetical protein [Vibrio gallaecicus]
MLRCINRIMAINRGKEKSCSIALAFVASIKNSLYFEFMILLLLLTRHAVIELFVTN